MKKILNTILAFALAMPLLGGCAFRSADQLYRLPKRSETYNDLQSAIDSAMTGFSYSAPLTGEQRQTVQMADLDGDGEQEYLLFAKADQQMPLRILIFDRVEESYVHVDTIESTGTAFDQVEYVQMDDRDGLEVVVGRQLSDQVLRSLSVYTFSGGEAEQLVAANYTKFLTVNLDADSYSELMVIRPGEMETDRGVVELYQIEAGNIERAIEVNMSEPADKLKRIVVGKLHDNTPAVYVASLVNESALITDVYAMVDDVFTNVTFSNESGTSVKTMRNYYVYADDIDTDGVVELPYLVSAVSASENTDADSQYIIRWYAMTADGGEVDKLYTYHNFVGGWYLELDSMLASRTTVTQTGNEYVLNLWNDRAENSEKLITIYVLTGQNRQEQGTADGRFVLYSTDSVVYSAKLEESAKHYGITQVSVTKGFHLIHQDWKTGET